MSLLLTRPQDADWLLFSVCCCAAESVAGQLQKSKVSAVGFEPTQACAYRNLNATP